MRAARRRVPSPGELLLLLAVFAMLFVLLYPMAWVLITSFKTPETMFSARGWVFTLDNYVHLMRGGFARNIVNSLYICITSVIVSTLFGVAAAYVFSRKRFRFKEAAFGGVMLGQTFPWIILVTPLFILFARLGLLNDPVSLIFVYVAVTLPFSIYLLTGYLQSVPRSLDEAALIDGASDWQIMFRVIAPVIMPGIIATATHAFLVCWSEYLFALAFLTQTELKTMPLALSSFFGENVTQWGDVMSAAVLTGLPPLLLFLPLQRELVAGLTAGADK